ncbi:Hypothetical predicted protein, partial [Pelobates cultripes]
MQSGDKFPGKHSPSMATTDPDPQVDPGLIGSEEFQSLLDTTMSKSISKAISSAMGAMSTTISDSITQALKQVDPALIDMPQAVHDGAQQPRNRPSGRATATRDWKRAKAHDILSDSDEEGDEGSDAPYSDPYEDELSE